MRPSSLAVLTKRWTCWGVCPLYCEWLVCLGFLWDGWFWLIGRGKERGGSGREQTHLVPLDRILQTGETVRIQIVGPHEDILLPRRHGERAHARHDVADRVPGPEQVDQPPVLRVEPAVPVHFGVIEAEPAVFLVDLDVQVRVAGEEFVAEGAVRVGLADFVGLVDDGADGGVFVEEDGGDEVFVGEVFVAEV